LYVKNAYVKKGGKMRLTAKLIRENRELKKKIARIKKAIEESGGACVVCENYFTSCPRECNFELVGEDDG